MWTKAKLDRAKRLQRLQWTMREIANDLDVPYEKVVLYLFGGLVNDPDLAKRIENRADHEEHQEAQKEKARERYERNKAAENTIAPAPATPAAVIEPAPQPAPVQDVVVEKPTALVEAPATPALAPAAIVLPAGMFRLRNKDKAYVRKNGQGVTYDLANAWAGTAEQAANIMGRTAFKDFKVVPA